MNNKVIKLLKIISQNIQKVNKLSLPVTILIVGIILGGFYYASQLNKQKSIEKQQSMELSLKTERETIRDKQDKKEYLVKRKKECYDFELSERKIWTNVDSSDYISLSDVCIVRYIDQKPKSEEECDKIYPLDESISFLGENLLCKKGMFAKEF